MTLQTTVRLDQGWGIIGEIRFNGPQRAEAFQIDPAATAANCLIGSFFTIDVATGLATPGGAIVSGTRAMAGILVNPKEYSLFGSSAGTLAPTLLLPPGAMGVFLQMGEVVVNSVNAIKIGQQLSYATATGLLGLDPGSGYAAVPGATVVDYASQTGGGGGLVVARMTN